MKRRQFLTSIAAAGIVPAIPAKAFVGGTGISEAIYAKAIYYTRLWGTSVPEMYTSALGLDLDQANQLFGKLVTDKVINAPNASGFAKAVSPFYRASAALHSTTDVATRPSGLDMRSSKPAARESISEPFGRLQKEDQTVIEADPSEPLGDSEAIEEADVHIEKKSADTLNHEMAAEEKK